MVSNCGPLRNNKNYEQKKAWYFAAQQVLKKKKRKRQAERWLKAPIFHKIQCTVTRISVVKAICFCLKYPVEKIL